MCVQAYNFLIFFLSLAFFPLTLIAVVTLSCFLSQPNLASSPTPLPIHLQMCYRFASSRSCEFCSSPLISINSSLLQKFSPFFFHSLICLVLNIHFDFFSSPLHHHFMLISASFSSFFTLGQKSSSVFDLLIFSQITLIRIQGMTVLLGEVSLRYL